MMTMKIHSQQKALERARRLELCVGYPQVLEKDDDYRVHTVANLDLLNLTWCRPPALHIILPQPRFEMPNLYEPC
jgi:hypothetical protein